MSPIDSPTVARLAVLAAAAYGDRPALRYKRDGDWRVLTFTEVESAVTDLAAGLRRLGVRPGDPVGLVSETRPEWTLCDLAVARAGAVCVPVYPTSSADECSWVLGHCGARLVICETPQRAAAVAALPGVETVVLIDPSPGTATTAVPLDELRVPATATETDELAAVAAEIAEDALATVVYTSGTTGPPKGCMLTHANWRASLRAAGPLMDPGPDDVVYMHLPLAHLLSRIVQMLSFEYGACIAYFGGDIRQVVTELAEVRPTHLPSVPRLFEKVHSIAKDLPPETVREAFGGRIRLAVTGAAPISPEILEFYASCGIPIFEGYGMTESTALISVNVPGAVRHGTVGRPLAGVDVRIARDGEILSRGANTFAGYLDNPEATAETVKKGWLHTGDLGELDSDGYLRITGRKKDIIITAAGKNLTPANLENDLRQSPYISQAVMLGDRRPYPIVLITLDPETTAGVENISELVQEALDAANANHAPPARARRFAILDRDFTIEEGTLTPSLKVKRRAVADLYADTIEKLYD